MTRPPEYPPSDDAPHDASPHGGDANDAAPHDASPHGGDANDAAPPHGGGANEAPPHGDASHEDAPKRDRLRLIPGFQGRSRSERGDAFFGPFTLRLLAPNMVTVLAICLGFTSVRFFIEGDFRLAALALIAAGALDVIDGGVARMLKASSPFGMQMDSLADFLNFGAIPALALHIVFLEPLGAVGSLAATFYCVCCALRLARFNVDKSSPSTDQVEGESFPMWTQTAYFVGMPAPGAALLAGAPFWLFFSGLIEPTPAVAGFTAAGLFFIGLLMISQIPCLSFRAVRHTFVRADLALFVLAASATLTTLAFTYPWGAGLGFAALYAVCVPGGIVTRARALRAYRISQKSDAAKSA